MNLNPSELRMKIDVTFIFQNSVLKPSRRLRAVIKPVFSLYPYLANVHNYILCKHLKVKSFLVFSWGTKWERRPEVG